MNPLNERIRILERCISLYERYAMMSIEQSDKVEYRRKAMEYRRKAMEYRRKANRCRDERDLLLGELR
jgi:hypothetical protein